MPSVLTRRVETVDARTTAGSLTFDGVVADWPDVVRAALHELPLLTTTSLDDEQAFIVFRRRFAASSGIQLDFAVGPTGSRLNARSQSSSGLHVGVAAAASAATWIHAPGPRLVGTLLDAIATAAAR
ncbi:hypothetical protein GCM10025867_06900 [Frondihabitans sucicola]|uniref:Uncharacterized protein n=1 Tax=Frondihabitans sucicola TaxID=1268041 RepID=A0ABM8GJ95_9MICO|nr:hypothetical protein [Frondihabitans sucicola]BDZ48449.1 hypothetical protein GCM10025867_06900 [Frondihabitans sucicola]